MLASLFGLALSAFLAATFLPGTTEAVLTGLILATDIEVWLLVAVASVFNVLGSVVNYTLGWYLERFRDSRYMPVSPEQLRKAQDWFRRYGAWALLLCWLPLVGDAFPIVAGFMRVPLVIALPLIAIGKTLRFVVVAYGVVGGQSLVG